MVSTAYPPAPGQFTEPLLDHESCRRFAMLSREEKASFIEANLTEKEATELSYLWPAWARQNQLPPPGRWVIWLIMAGRGFGKTRSGAEWIRAEVESGRRGRLALVGRTAADVRDVMIDGESGLLSISHPDFMPKHEASKRRLTWPNGAIATTFSAMEPDSLRGPQHDGAWIDEPAAWQYADTFDQLMFGMRLGAKPQIVATTTPKPTLFIKNLIKQPNVRVTGGTTWENLENLAPTFRDEVIRRYSGTHLGQQELLGLLVGEAEGALWTRARLEQTRVNTLPKLVRTVVGVDPAVTSEPGSDETGIVVAALGVDGHIYVLADYTLKGTPLEWAQAVVVVYYLFRADRVAVEANQGGDLLETVIRTVEGGTYLSYKKVHASEGKYLRAEPFAALYEQDRAHHVGLIAELEDEMCSWVQGSRKSPNRLDAAVHAATELIDGSGGIPLVTLSSANGGSRQSLLAKLAGQGEDIVAKQRKAQEQQELAGLLVDQRAQDELDRQAQLSRFLRDLGNIRR